MEIGIICWREQISIDYQYVIPLLPLLTLLLFINTILIVIIIIIIRHKIFLTEDLAGLLCIG